MSRALLYGFGGHGKVLAELLLAAGFREIGVFDDNPIDTSLLNNVIYLGKYDPNVYSDDKILIAVGNNKIRSELSLIIKHNYLTFIHPSAFVSPTCSIGEGSVILQNAVLQTNVFIGKHCIINIQSSIDHDTHVSDFNHIAPHVYIGSNSSISSFSEVNPTQMFPRFTKI